MKIGKGSAIAMTLGFHCFMPDESVER